MLNLCWAGGLIQGGIRVPQALDGHSALAVGNGPKEISHDFNASQHTETTHQRHNFLSEILMSQHPHADHK